MRRFLPLLAAVLISSSLFAQTETSQMVFPKKILVGDTAELHYTFRSNVDFFPNEEALDEKSLVFEKLPFEYDNEDYTITKAVIQRNGLLYTVVITFSPWKTGLIDFPQFDLLSAVFGNQSAVPFLIDPEPVEIVSVLAKGEDSGLRGIHGPCLFPGTIYAIYGASLLFVIILVLVLHTIIKWSEISEKMKERRTLRLYAKNARGAMRQFKKLEKNSAKVNDAAFCLAVQQIFRVYLTTRFGIRFETLSSNQFVSAFEKLTAGTMSDLTRENVFLVSEIFHRADYVRFAQNSLDSKRMPREKYGTELQEGERQDMLARSREIIKTFETGDENA